MNTNTAEMNELDCYFVWAEATTGYADPQANKLGHLQALASFFAPSIPNVADMNALACLRAILIAAVDDTLDTSDMNELACLRLIYGQGYTLNEDTYTARWNALACLRGIVSRL